MVTLVIGTYNPNRKWLQEAIDSSKGLFDETIIVDDGSDTPVPQATVRHETNKGFYEARNTGIRLAKGDIIASLDDDDYFDVSGVQQLKKFIKYHDSDVWHFPIMQFGDVEGVWGDKHDLPNILTRDTIPSGSWFKKSLWERLGGFQLPTAEDWDFWARAVCSKARFTYFPEIVYHHRMRQGSLSSKFKGNELVKIRTDILQRCLNL